jgi:hypothetical protein
VNTEIDFQTLLSEAILNPETFIRATFSGQQKGQSLRWERVTLRPVLIKNQRHLQFSYYDATQHITQNYLETAAAAELTQLLNLPFRNFAVVTQREQLQINISKKGKPIITRHKTDTAETLDLAHDRSKNRMLAEGTPLPFLVAAEIMTEDGRIKAGQRDKFRQINEFLRLLAETGVLNQFEKTPIQAVDFGCGSAALTFALYHYLNEELKLSAHITGVDIKQHLIERHQHTAQKLGWQHLTFEHTTIQDYQPQTPPDIVLALHACDTATDDAIAQGIRWHSKIIVCAPCCHHDLQAQLEAQPTPAPFMPVLRYGLFHERIGDVLTDSFRTLILRRMGYRVDVVQFVPAEHTPKNLMIRAVKVADRGSEDSDREYAELQQYWQVTPYLQRVLGFS